MMKLLFFLITYINLLIVQGSFNPAIETSFLSSSEQKYERDSRIDIESGYNNNYNYLESNLYPRNVGIKNEAYNCYMNSIFSCLYNIPFFQNAVYRSVNEMKEFPSKSESTLMALADIFVKMRMEKESLEISTTMFPALKHQMGWDVGNYECVLEFWERFAQTLPETVQAEFKIKTKVNFIRKSDGLLIKSVFDESNLMILPIPGQQEDSSISAMLEKKFRDDNPEDYIINSEDQGEYNFIDVPITEKIHIPIYNTITIENTPNVLIFGLKRLGLDIKNNSQIFNGTEFKFDEELKINDELYCLVGGVIFDEVYSHYFAFNLDLGSGEIFIHNDNNVSHYFKSLAFIEYLDGKLKSKSVLTFYVKYSVWHAIAEELKQLVRFNADIPLSVLFETQKESVNLEVKEFFENSVSDYTDISNIQIMDSNVQKNTDDLEHNNNNYNYSPINSQKASENSKIFPLKVKKKIKKFEFEFQVFSCKTRGQKAKAHAQKKAQLESETLAQTQVHAQAQKNTLGQAQKYAQLESETLEQLKKRLKEFLAPIFAPIKLKLKNPKYELGAEHFNFDRHTETEYESFALELVLSTFASNSSFLQSLFNSLVDSSDTKSLKYATAVVLIQMTTGGQEIDLIDLCKIIKNIENISFLDSEEGRYDEKVLQCFKFFCKHLDQSLIQMPQVKTVEFLSGTQIDEARNCDDFILESFKSVPSLPNFEYSASGIIWDKNENGRINRSVLNATSIIFPIFIDRQIVIDDTAFFSNGDIHLNFLGDYLVSGAIIYDKNTVNGLTSLLNQNLQKNLYLKYSKQLEGKFFKILNVTQHTETQLKMLEYFRQYSLVIICSKYSLWNLDKNVKLEDIPSHLIQNTLKKTYFNLIRKSKFFKNIKKTN